jgi:hypothetical protein
VNKQWTLFILVLLVGISAVLLTRPISEGFIYSNGKALVAWYIPLPLALFYFLLNVYLGNHIINSAWLSLLLFVLLWIPFMNDFTDSYQYYEQDDGTRYRLVATNMVQAGTLNAGDGAIFGTQDKTYMIQPGYRYYLALWIRLFGEENRMYQLFNMLLYLLAIVWLFVSSAEIALPERYRMGLMTFVLLSAPFVVKLIMLGLTEWLAITIFVFAVCFYFSKQVLPAILLIALLAFIRQNLVFVSILLMLWMVMTEKKKWLLIFMYTAVLLLPLYHNLYYAGKWQFFSVYDNPSTFFVSEFDGSPVMKIFKNVLFHISLYGGFNWRLDNLLTNALSLACIPLGTYLVIRAFFLISKNLRIWLLAIVAVAIVPTLVFGGSAYYPRFEWVNLFISIVTLIVMQRDSFYPRHLRESGKVFQSAT